MHTPHKLLGRKSKIDYKHAIYGNQHPMLYADNFYLLLFYRCRHCLARLFTKGNKKNRLLAKGKKCHVKKNAAVVRNFTLVLRWQRYSGEPAAIRNFQIFRRKMRRAICIVNKDPHRQSTDTYVRHFVSVYNIDTRKY